MGLERETKIPGIGGMNVDVVDMLLKQNDTRIIRNGRRIDTNDKLGTVTNIKGNAAITGGIVLPTNPKTVGSCKDRENEALIYFVSGDDKHSIYRYFHKTEILQKVYEHLDLNFSKSKRVYGDVIEGLLYFVSGNNEPRKLNIDKAVKYSNNLDGGYSVINRQVLDAIKYPPLFPPDCEYDTDSDINQNNIRSKLFQFRYSYVYDDKEISKTSPVSKVPLPLDEFSWDGEVIGEINKNNVINVTIASGPEIVEKIKLYVREGNNGLWALVEIIDKERLSIASDIQYAYKYFNNRSLLVENQPEIERLFDRVPLFTETQEYLHTNNLIYGGNTEWYPDQDIDVTLTPEQHIVQNLSPGNTVNTYEFTINQGKYVFVLSPVPTIGNIVTVTIVDNEDNEQSEDYVINSSWVGSEDIFATMLSNAINIDFYAFGVVSNTDGNEISIWKEDSEGNMGILLSSVSIIEYVNEVEEIKYTRFPDFKKGASHLWGIVYYDRANRSNNVATSPETRLYLPFYTEGTPAISNTAWRYGVKWEINHQPPIWATHYQWVYAKNQDILSWAQYIVKSAVVGPDDKKLIIDLDYQNKITLENNGFDNYFPNTIIKPYTFKKGDRIRFITQAKTIFTDDAGLGDLVNTYIDLEILGPELDGEGDATNKIFTQYISQAGFGVNSLAEIYTPRKQVEENIFYEIGQVFNIVNPGEEARLHGGPVNQVIGESPASGEFSRGDSYTIPRAFVMNLNDGTIPETPAVESMSYNDFNELEVFDYGRPNIIIEDVITEKRNSLLLSGKHFEDTDINELSMFDGLQSTRVNDKHGEIQYIEQKGYTLKVFQPRKVTSFYIGKGVVKQADISGNDILTISDKIIGPNNPSSTRFGCLDPFAIVTVNRNTYFYDHDNQGIIRDDPNGIDNISDMYGFNSEIKKIADKLDQECDERLITAGYDPDSKEIIFTFTGKLISGINDYFSETIVFREDTNQFTTMWEWKDGFNYGPESYASIGNTFVSFLKGNIWKHNINSIYNRFFEINRSILIDFRFNISPEKLKVYKSIVLDAIGNWDCKEYDDIIILDEHSSDEKQMKSRLLSDKFKQIQGSKYASFMQNSLSSSEEPKLKDLYNGSDLSGKILNLRLRCSDVSQAQLNSITVLFQISNIS